LVVVAVEHNQMVLLVVRVVVVGHGQELGILGEQELQDKVTVVQMELLLLMLAVAGVEELVLWVVLATQ